MTEQPVRRAVALWLAGAVLAGCGGAAAQPAGGPQETASSPSGAQATGTAPGPVVSAEASQTRPDAAAGGRFQVVVSNDGTVPFTVTSVRLVSPGFTEEPAADQDTTLPEGGLVSLPTPYGPVRCDGAAEPAEVELGMVVGGRAQLARVPLRSDGGLLERIHAKDCAGLALAEQVELTLDEELVAMDADGEPGLRTVLSLTRREAEGPVAITGVRGSVLYDLALPGGQLVLPAGQQAGQAPLVLSSRTCDGHSVAEAKKPYLFLAFVQVGSDEVASATVPVSPTQQAGLLRFLDEVCAGPSGPG